MDHAFPEKILEHEQRSHYLASFVPNETGTKWPYFLQGLGQKTKSTSWPYIKLKAKIQSSHKMAEAGNFPWQGSYDFTILWRTLWLPLVAVFAKRTTKLLSHPSPPRLLSSRHPSPALREHHGCAPGPRLIMSWPVRSTETIISRQWSRPDRPALWKNAASHICWILRKSTR